MQKLNAKLMYTGVLLAVLLLLSAAAYAVAPICPHVIGWNSQINTWAQGAPWIKVIFSSDITPAKNIGSKVFYRPWDADSANHDDWCLPSTLTGSQYADLVWAKISGLTNKPDAVSYRNEFNWDDPVCSKRTCAEFINYYNRLRALGYTGKIIFGSFSVGSVDTQIWDDPDLRAATDKADGVETHEYFDFTVDCCSPWLAYRHRDLAINAHPDHLGNKEWYIGEFGSDYVCGHCTDCDDPLCRVGWRDDNKLTADQYITQLGIYSQNVHPNVVAVFLFQQGASNWAQFEVMGTPVADWMHNSWAQKGTINGNVKTSGGANLSGATVSTNTGGYSAITDASGNYIMSNITPGTYNVIASKTGYASQTQSNKTVIANQTTSVSFTLTPNTGTITGNVKSGGANLSGATVATNTGGYTTTTDTSGNYTLSNVTAGSYTVTASKSGYYSSSNNISVTAGQTTTSNFTLTATGSGPIATEDFETMPSWSSGFDAAWGNAAAWIITTGGQSGNFLQANRTAGGSSVKAKVYSVPTNTDITISAYMKCPSFGSSYWMEFGYRFGNNTAEDFDANAASWTLLKKFANDGVNGNGNVWTQYTATVNTGSNTQVTIGYKLGGSGAGPTVGWDSFKIEGPGGTCTAPAITTQPTSQTTCAGQSVTFSVAASGTSPSYQWKKNGTNISGATSSSYTISSVTTGDAASYTCYVSNGCGNVTSNTATLTVNTAPAITTQPLSQTKSVGQSCTFSVVASGTSPSYQWKKNGTNISGATSSSYTIASVQTGDAGNYTCYVSNSCGNVTSNTATLTVSGGTIASEDFNSVTSWASTYDAAWGSAASFTSVTGGQSGNFLQASRTSQGSSSRVLQYTVPANTSINVSIYMKCPSYNKSYWMESAVKLGNYSASDFDANSATWTYIKKFADNGTNGNGNTWTQYSVTLNTGSNTTISVGYKHGSSGYTGPTVGWDTFRIQ